MNEALVSWTVLFILFVWRVANRKWSERGVSLVHRNPNKFFFGLLFFVAIFASIQAAPSRMKADSKTIWFMVIALVVAVLLGIESTYNKRVYLAGIWQYQFLTMLLFAIPLLKTLVDIVRKEFVHYGSWIPSHEMQTDLAKALGKHNSTQRSITNLTKDAIETELDELWVGDSVRYISLLGVFAALVTAIFVVYHVCQLAIQMSLMEVRKYEGELVTFTEMKYKQQKLFDKKLKNVRMSTPQTVELWSSLEKAVPPTRLDFSSLSEIRHDLVLQIVLLPLIFAYLALRAHLRMLRIFNGSVDKLIRTENGAGLDWNGAKDFNMNMFNADLDLASAAEIYTILCLLNFCLDLVREKVKSLQNNLGQDDKTTAADLTRIVKNTSLQGVFSFVLMGTLKAVASLLLAVSLLYTGHHSIAQCRRDFQSFGFVCTDKTMMIQEKMTLCLTSLQPIMILCSLQCIWNMMSICGFSIKIKNIFEFSPFEGMKELKDQGFHTKLTGVRCLILIAQIQLTFLKFVTKKENLKLVPILSSIEPWNMYEVNAVHSGLICCECLGVAILQFHLWRWSQIEKILGNDPEQRFGSKRNAGEDLNQPLLPA